MGPSRERMLGRAQGTSRGDSGGVLGLEGPLFLSDWAGGTAEPGQLLEGKPLLPFLCFSSACSNHDSPFTTLHAGHHVDARIAQTQV